MEQTSTGRDDSGRKIVYADLSRVATTAFPRNLNFDGQVAVTCEFSLAQ
jgi:hypothetical protein